MKASAIITQLASVLPKQTDYFSQKVAASSVARAGTTVTVVTSSAHGLSTGNIVNVTGAKTPVTISSLAQVDGVATAVTASNHDLTEGWENGVASDSPNVEIVGATEADYNGDHSLLSVPNRRTFTYSVDSGAAATATGSPELLWMSPSGYNGLQTVTVVDTTTFTYEITSTPASPAQGDIYIHTGFRISGAAVLEAFDDSYTPQGADDLWLCVVLEDVAANKSRHVFTDATEQFAPGNAYRQRMIKPFSLYVYVPATSEIAARQARDLMEDLEVPLFKALLRAQLDESLSTPQEYGVTFSGHGFQSYNGAVYVHRFAFETVVDIVYEDTTDPAESVAFRDVELNINDENGVTELSVTVNLDDEPL